MTDEPLKRKRGRPPKPKPPVMLKQPHSMTGGRGPSPLVGVRLPPELHEKLKIYAEEHAHPTLSAAAREILEIKLAEIGE